MIIEQDGMRRELDSFSPGDSHMECEHCGELVCSRNPDGTSDCAGCNKEPGEDTFDPDGKRVGCLHDDCREAYMLALLVAEIESALSVRLPLGMEPWKVERARNLADRLRSEFNITPKEGNRK